MKKNFKKVNAAIIVIGNEILSGRTQDLNVSFISKWLNEKNGISVGEVRVIPDIEKIIVKTTNELRKKFNYIFTTGGIGPTHDDITAKSISKLFKVKQVANIAIEEKRSNKEIGSSLEAEIKITVDDKNFQLLEGIDLAEYFITSKAEKFKSKNTDDLKIEVKKMTGNKCPRCWKILEKKCVRCDEAVS